MSKIKSESKNLLTILKEENYSAYTPTPDRIFAEFTRKTLESVLGRISSSALIAQMSSVYGLSDEEFLSKNKLLADGLRSVFRTSTEVIFEMIKNEMLPHTISKNSNSSLEDAVNEISAKNVFNFLQKRARNERMGIFYQNEINKDIIVSQFLEQTGESRVPTGVFSVERYHSRDAKNFLYKELLKFGRSKAMKRMNDSIYKLHRSNKSNMPTRVACSDTDWFFDNGFEDELMEELKSLGRYPKENISVLCSYCISRLSEEVLRKLIWCYEFVILDRPFVVYRAGDA